MAFSMGLVIAGRLPNVGKVFLAVMLSAQRSADVRRSQWLCCGYCSICQGRALR